jgi:hypothetical protein
MSSKKRISIKKAMKWKSKEAKQTKTKFVPPTSAVVKLLVKFFFHIQCSSFSCFSMGTFFL